MDTYTKLSIEIKFPDGEISRVEIAGSRWDMSAGDLFEMARALFLAEGYAETTVEELFGEV